jgi:hypothetical protein
VRACIQEILAKYSAQGITGVRFQFNINDALAMPLKDAFGKDLKETDATIRPQWAAEVADFFQDLYNNHIYNITPTIETENALNQDGGLSKNTLWSAPTPTYSTWYSGGTEVKDLDRWIMIDSPANRPGCEHYPSQARFRFTPTSPIGWRCQGSVTDQKASNCDIDGNDYENTNQKLGWDIDRGDSNTSAVINDSYKCSPTNPVFVGWDKIYSVIDELLYNARHPFGSVPPIDRHLTVEELDARNEIDLEYLPIRARLIVDNTHGNWDVLGTSPADSLMYRMALHGFDETRVTYSAMDKLIGYSPATPVPQAPGSSPNNEAAPTNVAGFDCASVYGDSARELGASQLLAALGGGKFGWFDSPGAYNQLPCLVSPTEQLTSQDILNRINDITANMVTLPIVHPAPSILDVHTAPCINVPLHDAQGNTIGDCDPIVANVLANPSEVTQTATVQFNALNTFLASFGPGGAHCCYNTDFANALMMLGETDGQLQTGCKMFTGAGWDRLPETATKIAAGFNLSSLACPTISSCHPGTVVFRPWENLVNQPDRLPNQQIDPQAPDRVRCNPIVVNQQFTPNK